MTPNPAKNYDPKSLKNFALQIYYLKKYFASSEELKLYTQEQYV